MSVVEIGIGFMMLIAGRPAYWVFVGGMTFLIGSYFARQLIVFSLNWNNVILSLVFALSGVLLAFLARRWAARIAGFIAGGYLVYNIPLALGGTSGWATPVYFAIAGFIAIAFLLFSFDIGMVIVSSLVAVTFILSNMQAVNLDRGILFVLLLVLSLTTQYLVMQYARPTPD